MKTHRQPRYHVNVWQWDQSEQCYARVAHYSGYRLNDAKRRADIEARLLPVSETTWELRSYARSGFVTVSLERHMRYDGCHYRAPGMPLAVITMYTALATWGVSCDSETGAMRQGA